MTRANADGSELRNSLSNTNQNRMQNMDPYRNENRCRRL